jgi:DnaJ-domain-containing protein 1
MASFSPDWHRLGSAVQHVLLFSDPRVRERLFSLVEETRGLLLVVGVRHGPGMRSPELREPFASLERAWGTVLTQVLVADEGTVEGMWRDPLGDLAARLLPDSRQDAYAAASGFLLVEDGQPCFVVKKGGVASEDLWFLQEALSRLTPRVPPPDPALRPGARRPASAKAPPPPDADVTPPHGTRVPPPEPPAPPPPPKRDAWAVLGLTPGTPLDEARRAFRALVAQYHPDKVAHLAPEFHELAERRTREILAAWEEVERALS